ncbi:protein THYLAKOID ASSEMBLY 8, chloroplastic [Mercurialis annua]|uniref:protein THYLAKOID ASSEMBLY 8, chloroplastic n=1 Tax=Mercurialis annua TaxID=3986 RepID=UPI00215FC1A3|nr:protein THYLAKOID ASSEMBLY 8, chloroplastic [Mercurialis annua]
MALSLHKNLIFLPPKTLSKTLTTTTTATVIRCGSGPRSNRGPLVKGRILSKEAILAVQSLKRSYNKSPPSNLPDLTRLLKSDLSAILKELLRQDLCLLALHVLTILRSEFSDQIDLNLYGEVISALTRNKLEGDIDRLIDDLGKDEGKIMWESDRGFLRVVRGVVDADRKESTVKIVQMLRRSGCGDTWPADAYIVGVLSKGLRRMGEEVLADEVDKEFGGVFKGNLDKLSV